MDLDNTTVIGDIIVRLVDHTTERHEQQLGGNYAIRDGCLVLANHDETKMVAYPLTSVLSWTSSAVENINEIREAYAEQERKEKEQRLVGRRAR